MSHMIGQDHTHGCFKGVLYNWVKSYSCMLQKCSKLVIRLSKNILIYVLKISCTVGQEHIHICFKDFILFKIKIILIYALKVFCTINQDYIHIYFEGILYSWVKTYWYMFGRCFVRPGKTILMYVLKMSYIVGQKPTYICFESVLYSLRLTKIKVLNGWARIWRSTKEEVPTIWSNKVYMPGQNNKVNVWRDCRYNSKIYNNSNIYNS